MTTDFRALCVELTDCLEKADWPHRYKVVFQQWTDIARAALAEPEPEGPTDEELLELSQYHSVSYTMSDGKVVYPLQQGSDMRDDVLSFARAVLARWGNNTSRSN